ncbi:MAG: aminotransferase class I/II-fold pyridoxal phosphate-dependent enzyme [Saprospiraceae bacterium]|nr:aminotransferase class I/II-fold pyridoxal phosphate-dependent enzyme [Saprospiraceae bacterium]
MKVVQAKRLESVKTYYFAKKLAEIAAINQRDEVQIINLGIGSPDLLPPESVIETLKNAASNNEAHKYQSYKGLPILRDAFSKWYQRFFNVEINPHSEVLPLMGSKEGIMHISMSLLNPGDEVLVPDPGYPAYRMTAALAGATTRFYNLKQENHWLPDLEELAKEDLSKVKIMWINYPHMPTGAKADLEFYGKLIAFAKAHDILVCHDNPYVFILNDNPISILQVEGAKDNCIELISLSKCYNMAGWRIGALIGHENAINTVLKFKSNMASGMFRPLQEAAAKALSMDESWMRKLDDVYEKRKKIAQQIMTEIGAEYEVDNAGLFVWAKISEPTKTVEEFCDEILYKAKVFITPGHIFGNNGEGYVRISLCSSEETLLDALSRIKKNKI